MQNHHFVHTPSLGFPPPFPPPSLGLEGDSPFQGLLPGNPDSPKQTGAAREDSAQRGVGSPGAEPQGDWPKQRVAGVGGKGRVGCA